MIPPGCARPFVDHFGRQRQLSVHIRYRRQQLPVRMNSMKVRYLQLSSLDKSLENYLQLFQINQRLEIYEINNEICML